MKKLNKLIILLITFCNLNINAQIVPNYVPTNGLVGWWPFTGNANDLSGNGNNGTNYGATLTTDRFSIANSTYSFNAPLINRIVVPNSPSLNPNLISVSIWVNPTSFGPSEQYIIDKSIDINPISVNRSWAIRIGGNGQLDLEIRVNNIYYSFAATSTLSLNQWNHLVFVYDGITAKLYKDNIIVISQSLPGTLTNFNYNLSIGYFPHTNLSLFGYFWNGKLDDIGIWNRALTECEIEQLYNASVSLTPTVSASTSNSVICIGGSAILTASTTATTYTWNTSATTMSISVSPTVTSTYTVSVSNASACVNTSTVMVTVDACTGINEVIANPFSIYPNPNNGVFTIELNETTQVIITNVLGNILLKSTFDTGTQILDIKNNVNGIYFLQLNQNGKQRTIKLIKE